MRLITSLLLVAALATPLAGTQPQPPQPINVMSFNIRYGTANDGDNHWNRRRAFLMDVVSEGAPDILGVQEALDAQIHEMLSALPAYAALGVGRDDGKTRGEYAAIFYRRDRFTVSDTGTFWLSDTPEVVASRTWGNTITRICTWARLVDRDGRAYWVYNVHFDHQSQPSRERSAALLRQRIATRRVATEPVVVTGDFNAGEKNPAVLTMTTPSSDGAPLIDTFRTMHPDDTTVGTFTGFTFGQTGGDKIDYVFVSSGLETLAAAIVRTSRDNRYPSDHFPVTARVVAR